ncbi:MAG: penicillin-binding protein 2 [Patescibacteria group bacterium]
MSETFTARIHLIFIAFFVFALILGGRLFFVQIVHGGSYKELADDQYVTPVANIFDRGNIFFQGKNGELVSAATVQTGYIIAIDPTRIKDADGVFEKISAITSIDRDGFFAKIAKTNDPYEEIARRVPKDEAYAIGDIGIVGVSVHKERWRFYPALRTAAHMLGFIGYKGDKQTGVYGLERYYNDILSRGEEGLYVNFFAELFSNITDSILKTDNSRAGDLVLTIEPKVQSVLEEALGQVKMDWSSESVGGIIMDPMTGAIYAMASLPDFDPNDFQYEKNTAVFSNPIVERVYEMGSIIKPLTMAAALDVGAVTAKTTYNDKGYVVLNSARISNFDGKARGVVPMQEVLNQSLNTGMVFVMQKMGPDIFSTYMKSYGIGVETGIELPNETHGLIDNLDSTRDIEHATAAFGQGIAMTPIETVRALSALGNGGYLPSPHLVDRVEYVRGDSKKTYPDPGAGVLKKETSDEITRMLVTVVDKALLDGTVAMPHYSIAAKTGTAQIADLVNGGYYDDRYLHSFFGYFPAYNPRFIIFLYNVYPKDVKYASQTLTSPFIDMTKFLINYYEIPPDR